MLHGWDARRAGLFLPGRRAGRGRGRRGLHAGTLKLGKLNMGHNACNPYTYFPALSEGPLGSPSHPGWDPARYPPAEQPPQSELREGEDCPILAPLLCDVSSPPNCRGHPAGSVTSLSPLARP